MILTQTPHYCSPFPWASKGYPSELSDFEPVVAPDEIFQPTSAWETITRSYIIWVGTFDNMKETRGGIRDRFSGWGGTIYVQDWKVHYLMVLYLQQLYMAAIRGCFAHFPRDVTFVSEADLRLLGLVDMVIAGRPCQSHSCVGASRGEEDPKSSLFLEPRPAHAVMIYLPNFISMVHIWKCP